jgi:hypothetical protein
MIFQFIPELSELEVDRDNILFTSTKKFWFPQKFEHFNVHLMNMIFQFIPELSELEVDRDNIKTMGSFFDKWWIHVKLIDCVPHAHVPKFLKCGIIPDTTYAYSLTFINSLVMGQSKERLG